VTIHSVSKDNGVCVAPKGQSESKPVQENNRAARNSTIGRIALEVLACLGLLAGGIASITCGAICANPFLICAGVGMLILLATCVAIDILKALK
jgi:hypothetical protein